MPKHLLFLVPLIALAACGQTTTTTTTPAVTPSTPTMSTPQAMTPATAFTLTSTSFKDGETLPTPHVANSMGCTGGNSSPALSWSGAPAGTRSFALTVFDPDAQQGKGWWHWLAYDIPASATSLAAGAGTQLSTALPAGTKQAPNGNGIAAFGGACPPVGESAHHYVFTLYALPTDTLTVAAAATPQTIEPLLKANAIASTKLTATYSR